MKDGKFIKVALIVVMVLLTLDIVTRIVFSQQEVLAAKNVQYQLISAPPRPRTMSALETARDKYEILLNDMASQGWEFDHMAFDNFMVFKK